MKRMMKKVAAVMMAIMMIAIMMIAMSNPALDPAAQGNAPIGGGANALVDERGLMMPDVASSEEVRDSIVSGTVPEWLAALPKTASVETLQHELVFGAVSEPLWVISDGSGAFEEMSEEVPIA